MEGATAASAHCFFQLALHLVNGILMVARLLPLVPEVGQYSKYLAATGTAPNLTHCDKDPNPHLVILLTVSLSLTDCLCNSSTLACSSVNSSLVCRSCPSRAYTCTRVYTLRRCTRLQMDVRTYIRTYVWAHHTHTPVHAAALHIM